MLFTNIDDKSIAKAAIRTIVYQASIDGAGTSSMDADGWIRMF